MNDAMPEMDEARRLVGWKAIAGHLKVSQRTAVRWADNYGLPVSRVPRGNRPLVYATAADLNAWWGSAAAREANGEEGCARQPEEPRLPLRPMDAFQAVEPQARADSGIRQPRSVLRRAGRLRVLALFACVLATAGGVYSWHTKRSGTGNAESTTSRKIGDRAHGEATTPALVELRVAPAGQVGFTVRVAEGEMARLETPDLSLGLQAKVVGRQLEVFVYRLRPLGTGESADYLESRVLPPGDTGERVRIEGTMLELRWPGEIPAGVAAAQLPRSQCCMVCTGLTMCGRFVSATCGGCQGELKQERMGR